VFIGPRTDYSRQLFASVAGQRLLELDTVSLQEKTDALAACSLLCVPSTQESFGGVYTEAWSLGKPVIGCRIPAVAELIMDGEDGFLVAQQPAEIADRILQLLTDPSLARALGSAGQRKVQARFTWLRLAALTEQAYLDVLA
jgi:glycosyltransferase involved in cell wall biosynthesis